MMSASLRPQCGVTLVELIAVMSVAAILLALAVPSFSEHFARRRLEGVANELSADLQHTRTLAVSENQPATLAFISGGSSYTITQGSKPVQTRTLPTGVTLTTPLSSVASVTFDPVRGTATAGNFAVAVASLGTSANLRLSTNLLGHVELCSPGTSLAGYKSCGS
jgi:type IV fimbrial biogenesis protein FimT